jgi:hypothetical protein
MIKVISEASFFFQEVTLKDTQKTFQNLLSANQYYCIRKTPRKLNGGGCNPSYLVDYQNDQRSRPVWQIVYQTPSPKSPEQNGPEVWFKW